MPNDARTLAILHEAVMLGDVTLIKYILKEAASMPLVNTIYQGALPLYWAIHGGHLHIVELLLLHGADANANAPNRALPLWQAIKSRHGNSKGIVEKLLIHNADVNSSNKFGITPLMNTSYNGDSETTELLLLYHADPGQKCNLGQTAFHYGMCGLVHKPGMNMGTLEVLLNSVGVDSTDNEGQTSLMMVCGEPQPHCYTAEAHDSHVQAALQFLVEHGASVKIQAEPRGGCTALDFAVNNNLRRSVKYLLTMGAYLQSALDIAITKSSESQQTGINVKTRCDIRDMLEMTKAMDQKTVSRTATKKRRRDETDADQVDEPPRKKKKKKKFRKGHTFTGGAPSDLFPMMARPQLTSDASCDSWPEYYLFEMTKRVCTLYFPKTFRQKVVLFFMMHENVTEERDLSLFLCLNVDLYGLMIKELFWYVMRDF